MIELGSPPGVYLEDESLPERHVTQKALQLQYLLGVHQRWHLDTQGRDKAQTIVESPRRDPSRLWRLDQGLDTQAAA